MGGFGSGNHRTRKPATGGRRRLDVRELARAGALTPGTRAAIHWTDGSAVAVRVESGRVLVAERPVRLAGTPCGWGGSRPWFLCPSCGRRVAILYFGPGGAFACRTCQRLVYPSTREDATARAFRRAAAIRRRLGWPPGVANGHGPKPKGMQWATFTRLVAEHDAHAERAWAGLLAKDAGLRKRLAGAQNPAGW